MVIFTSRTHFVGSLNSSKRRLYLPEINEFQDLALSSSCMAWNLALFIHNEIPYLEINKNLLITLDLFRLWCLSTFKKNFWHHEKWNLNVTPNTLKLLDFAKIPNGFFFTNKIKTLIMHKIPLMYGAYTSISSVFQWENRYSLLVPCL